MKSSTRGQTAGRSDGDHASQSKCISGEAEACHPAGWSKVCATSGCDPEEETPGGQWSSQVRDHDAMTSPGDVYLSSAASTVAAAFAVKLH